MPKLYAALADLTALDPDPAAEPPRLPRLEALLSRGERLGAPPDWRRWALEAAGATAPPGDLPLARALARQAGLAPDASEAWLLATPVHFVAGMTQLRLHHAGALAFAPQAAAALAARFALDWSGPGPELIAAGAQLLLRLPEPGSFETRDPDLWAGREVGAGLPTGADGGQLRRLMTELQMWLHAALPAATNGLPVNGLWLWGGGVQPIGGSPRWPRLAGGDAALAALAAGAPHRDDADLVSYRVADLATRSLAFEDADEAWFAPLAARLASGEIAEARLHVGSSEYRLRGRQRWRLWVRPRPWWELAA